jgi:hypothetical protein
MQRKKPKKHMRIQKKHKGWVISDGKNDKINDALKDATDPLADANKEVNKQRKFRGGT